MPKPIPPAKREEAMALYAVEQNYHEVSRKTGLAVNTIKGIVTGADETGAFAQYRTAKKLEFIANAWERIGKLWGVLDEKYKNLDAKDAVVAIAVLYDKLAQASGESPTTNIIGDKIVVMTGVPRPEGKPNEEAK